MGYEELSTIRKGVLITELGLLSDRLNHLVNELNEIKSKLDNISTVVRILDEASKDPEYKGW
jgi:hypothetical protein